MIKSSPNFKEFTADDIFDEFDVKQLTGTVFMNREECKNAKSGMDAFTDLMYDVLPTYLGVRTADDVREVCRKAKNPQAKAFLEAFETAMENAKYTDKFLNSVQVHKNRNVHSSHQIKSSKGSDKIVADTKEKFYTEIENLGYEIIDDSDGKWLTLEDFPSVYEAEYTQYSDGDYELMLYNIRKIGNRLQSARQIKSSVDTSEGSFFCAQVPDNAFLQAGYLQFEGNDVWMVFQKRDKETGDIISEKEITENDLIPVNSLQSSAIKSSVDKQHVKEELRTNNINSSHKPIKSSRVMTAEEANFHEGDVYKNRYGWVIVIDELDGDYVHIVQYLDEKPEEKETHMVSIPRLYEHLRDNNFTNMTKGKINNSNQSFIQSAVNEINEEDPVEVLLKDAAEHFGATYKEGWYGKGIQEGDGDWSGGRWAVLVDENNSLDKIPIIHFIAAKGSTGVTPINAKTAEGEQFPEDLIYWIENKIREDEEDKGDWHDQVVVFKEADVEGIDYIDSNPSTRTVYIKTATKSDDEAEDIAQKFVEITGNENYEIYDFYETTDDSYEDLDSDIRDEKVIIFSL